MKVSNVRAVHHPGVDPQPLLQEPRRRTCCECIVECADHHWDHHKFKHGTAYCVIIACAVLAYLWPSLWDEGQCPMDNDTGYPCRVLICGDKTGITTCSDVTHTCVCEPGYCSNGGFCQLNATSVLAKVAPVNSEHPVFPGAHANVRTALCISGGGSRSLTLTLGALRALEHLELMPRVDAISSVSGGSWAAAVYMFANVSKKSLLGDFNTPYDPSQLTLDKLAEELPRLGQVGTTSMFQFVFDGQWSIDSQRDTLWQRYVGEIILKSFGLHGRDAFMAASPEHAARIRAENPALEDVKFVTPQPGRPKVFVMNAALLAPLTYVSTADNVVSFQASPDFTGSPFYPLGKPVVYEAPVTTFRPSITRWVGGGFVESFAVGGAPPKPDPFASDLAAMGDELVPVEVPRPKVPMTLEFALGASSAAFAKMFQRFQYWGHVGVDVDPTFKLWPIPQEHNKYHINNNEHLLGDGGNIENAGLLAMLQRGASRIIWLVNTDTGINPEIHFCDMLQHDPESLNPAGWTTDQVTDKFGYGHNSASTWLGKNQVFPKTDFLPLLCTAQKLMNAGSPTVVKKTHTVVPNSWWGIKGGNQVDVLYVFNENCNEFEHLLPEDTYNELKHGDKFKNYPFYKTTVQNFPQFTALTTEQVHLLAAQAEYFMLQNTDLLHEILA